MHSRRVFRGSAVVWWSCYPEFLGGEDKRKSACGTTERGPESCCWAEMESGPKDDCCCFVTRAPGRGQRKDPGAGYLEEDFDSLFRFPLGK